MENLTENGILALKKIIMAQNEFQAFAILNEYKIDNFEGNMLLHIFHETNTERQKAKKETANKIKQIKIEQLKKKYDYLQSLTDNQIEMYYEHLLVDPKDNGVLNKMRYQELINYSSQKRANERRIARRETLINKGWVKVVDGQFKPKYEWDFCFSHTIASIEEAGRCTKCEQLLECKCL